MLSYPGLRCVPGSLKESLTCCGKCMVPIWTGGRWPQVRVRLVPVLSPWQPSSWCLASALLWCLLTPCCSDYLGMTSFCPSCNSVLQLECRSQSWPSSLPAHSAADPFLSFALCRFPQSQLHSHPCRLSVSLPVLYSSQHYNRVHRFFILKERAEWRDRKCRQQFI